jgi:hypothetical protein
MDDKQPPAERVPGDHGHGRDPADLDPGAHVDFYKGGDRGQSRLGPEGGFEERADFRRSERHAEQGQAEPAAKETDSD